ncbi:MAG: MazG family protein [Clostridia bacterium]|nr:MazG family protein [Clostridia bacterium]
MTDFERKEKYDFNDLRTIMRILRSPGGCPWDIEQTHQSIRNDFIEEAYEAVEGIDKDDPAILREELGDVLLQVVFHADISEENGDFTVDDVITDLCKKLIIRHPHVFSTDDRYSDVDSAEKVLENWNEIKKQTKGQDTVKQELEGVSRALPSLYRAQKISKKLRKAGLPVDCSKDAAAGLLSDAYENKDMQSLGKLLLTLCALADRTGINAEEALYKTTEDRINEIG